MSYVRILESIWPPNGFSLCLSAVQENVPKFPAPNYPAPEFEALAVSEPPAWDSKIGWRNSKLVKRIY